MMGLLIGLLAFTVFISRKEERKLNTVEDEERTRETY